MKKLISIVWLSFVIATQATNATPKERGEEYADKSARCQAAFLLADTVFKMRAAGFGEGLVLSHLVYSEDNKLDSQDSVDLTVLIQKVYAAQLDKDPMTAFAEKKLHIKRIASETNWCYGVAI